MKCPHCDKELRFMYEAPFPDTVSPRWLWYVCPTLGAIIIFAPIFKEVLGE